MKPLANELSTYLNDSSKMVKRSIAGKQHVEIMDFFLSRYTLRFPIIHTLQSEIHRLRAKDEITIHT